MIRVSSMLGNPMPDIMAQALNLALYGMGSVFVFLTVLVGLTTLMSKFVAVLPGGEETVLVSPKVPPASNQISAARLAAVTAAVKQYRERH